MLRLSVFIFLIALIVSCNRPYTGKYTPPIVAKSFANCATPPAPDYSNPNHWAALPTKKDMADSVPNRSVKDGQAQAQVDVFFLHPTLYLESGEDKTYPWNADVNDAAMNAKVDGSTILNQASVFNGSCRVYAPRYRQAHISSFFTSDTKSGEAALALAYEDTKAAFLYYLENFNNGRPFFIAGHSQGTRHAGLLIREFIDGKPLAKKLIAAYVIGMPVPSDYFNQVPICDSPDQTGCYITWATYQKGFYPLNYESAGFNRGQCVNPLCWTTDSTFVSRNKNIGGITWKFNKVKRRINGAQSHKGILWIEKPHVLGRMFIHIDNYHVADYNLFWFNIRDNVRIRSETYLKNTPYYSN